MATAIITSFGQICDSNGVPVSGALITVSDAGLTNLRALFSDPDLTTPTANPIVTDSSGRHQVGMVYTAAGSYKIVVKTSAGASIFTRDNIDGGIPVGSGALAISNGGTGSTTANGALAALGAATAAEVADLSTELAAVTGAQASTAKTHIATGTTAQRDAVPSDGDIRRNTTIPQWEAYNGATLTWEKLVVSPIVNADFPVGCIVGRTKGTYTSNADITGTIPYDNTIPQVGEGTQIISVAPYTMKAAANILAFRFSGDFSCATSGIVPIIAVFVDGGANAIGSFASACGDNAGEQSIYGEFEYAPGDLSAHTFTVRVGTNGGSTIRFNGTTSAARFSTSHIGTRLVIEEVKV